MSDQHNVPIALQSPDLPYTIRPVQLSDTVQLKKVLWQDRTLRSITDFVQRIIKFESEQRGVGIVVVDDDQFPEQILAYGQVTQWVKCAEISDLMVHPTHRGQGIGTAMIQYLMASVPSRANCVELGVAESNPRALALYRRLGFCDSYTLQLDLGNGTESVIYLQIDLSLYTTE